MSERGGGSAPVPAFVSVTKADLESMTEEELHSFAESLGYYLDINAEKGALIGQLSRVALP